MSGEAEHYRGKLEEWRHAEKPLVPFHWKTEFPEVFDREDAGFDAFVGNPPFMGGVKISGALSVPYLAFLYRQFPGAGGQADLVTFFFRLTFQLLRDRGAAGLVATNSIAQGDTRESGLTRILTEGGVVFSARRRVKWLGGAAVIVSVVHFSRGDLRIRPMLDGKPVERINAFLLSGSTDRTPARLNEHGGKRSFLGSMVAGVGFTFDDDNEGATPVADMRSLLDKDPKNAQRIFPFIGGQEINSSPTQAHHRWIIDFDDMSEEDARHWPDLFEIVRRKVKPYRDTVNRDAHRLRWWQYGDRRVELYQTIRSMKRVLAISQVTQYVAFTFLPAGMVYSHRLYIIADERYATYAVLQCSLHDIWARSFGSSLEERFMYAAADCFDTYPFPEGWKTRPALEVVGETYYEFRAALMVKNNEGLTKTYNRCHDPDERDPDILKLRQLHAAMDRAVLEAYGWSDIPTECEFILDYEIDEEEWGSKKKPYRYRWPDEVRDDVLARLLELNAERAEEELRSGSAAAKKGGKKAAAKRAPKASDTEELFS